MALETVLAQVAAEARLPALPAVALQTQDEHGRQQAEATLRQAEEHLRQSQKMEAVARLTGGVAHDFNNLLTVINGYSEVLLNRLPPQDPCRAFAEEIKKAGDRAARLTRQLLAFGRKQVLAPTVLNLSAVVHNVETMLRRLIGEGILLRTVLASSLRPVVADPCQVEQVLVNLAANARDAMPRGGTLTIETADADLDDAHAAAYPGLRPGPYVRLSVSDNGTGMDSETMAHLFEPFFTTKEVGKGTGLGLASVHGGVQQSGGHISVYSEPGAGSRFNIYLPVSPDPVAAPTTQVRLAEPARGSETVLVAEDEEGVRNLVRRTLAAHGYTVLGARDGQEALEFGESHTGSIHLLLTDIVMPRLSGSDLARHLKQSRPGLKLLYMSGYMGDSNVRQEVVKSGVAFIQKPFSPQVLLTKIREVLDRCAVPS